MSEKSQFTLLAQYNHLMNQRMIEAAEKLPGALLAENKGAFFKSVLGTLNHIMVGDILWLKRFSAHPIRYKSLYPINELKKPARLDEILCNDLPSFREKRAALDGIIIQWCNELNESDLARPIKYTNYKGEAHNKRLGALVLHLFLHQVHHRGQVTTLLSQEGMDFGETDLPELIPDVIEE